MFLEIRAVAALLLSRKRLSARRWQGRAPECGADEKRGRASRTPRFSCKARGAAGPKGHHSTKQQVAKGRVAPSLSLCPNQGKRPMPEAPA
jgi:hypothetical protein